MTTNNADTWVIIPIIAFAVLFGLGYAAGSNAAHRDNARDQAADSLSVKP